MTDLDLLQQYTRSGCQNSFGELVGRHIDMVYSTSLRRLRNRQDAEDATRAVFIALAEKAAELTEKTVLGGWLYHAATYVCMDMLRKAKRREEHEMAAAIEKAANRLERDQDRVDIDEALGKLNSADREAVVLRFLENRSFREVGFELRISEEAARKRVSRAMERLRGTPTGANGAALSLAGVEQMLHACLHPAPPDLLARATHAAMARSATTCGGVALTKGAATIMATTYTKLLAGAAVLALLSGGTYVGYRMAAPQPRITVVASENTHVTSAMDGDWKKRFTDSYQLAPGQVVRFVEHVPVAERLQYWKIQSNHGSFLLEGRCNSSSAR